MSKPGQRNNLSLSMDLWTYPKAIKRDALPTIVYLIVRLGFTN